MELAFKKLLDEKNVIINPQCDLMFPIICELLTGQGNRSNIGQKAFGNQKQVIYNGSRLGGWDHSKEITVHVTHTEQPCAP